MVRVWLVVAALLGSTEARAWGTHHLITRAALDRPGSEALDAPIAVEPLDAYLAADADGVAAVFRDFAAWEKARGATRFAEQPFDGPTTAAFLKAARLQPKARLGYVRRLPPGPGATAPADLVPLAGLSDFAKPAPAFTWWFVPEGATTSGRDVLATYSDEPDWGFDHELWDIQAYGYGEQNFGKPTGESSKAPIHMWFAHENGLVRTFASEVTESVVLDRVELFTRLAKRAFAAGHPYWGYRFAAWAVHYTEDLAQPYHSRALPGKRIGYYLRYVVSPTKERMKTKATQTAGNRHFLYEDYVSLALEQGYRGEAGAPPLAKAAATGEAANAADVPALLEWIGADASAHGPVIDHTLGHVFGKRWTSWKVDLEKEPAYDIAAIVRDFEGDAGARLLDEAVPDFTRTGVAVRETLRLAGAPAP